MHLSKEQSCQHAVHNVGLCQRGRLCGKDLKVKVWTILPFIYYPLPLKSWRSPYEINLFIHLFMFNLALPCIYF